MTHRNLLPWIVALVSLASSPARAEHDLPPQHVHLQGLTPLPEEAFSPLDGQRQDNQFGASVVIRNGLAFIGMPATMTTGQVAVYTQGTTGWVRSERGREKVPASTNHQRVAQRGCSATCRKTPRREES